MKGDERAEKGQGSSGWEALTLVKTVEKEGEELLRVVLFVPVKRGRELDDRFLQDGRSRSSVCQRRSHLRHDGGSETGTDPERKRLDEVVFLIPQRRDERRVRARKIALCAERVVHVDRALPAAV